MKIVNEKMNKYTWCLVLNFMLFGCRPVGDDLLSYGQEDDQAFASAYMSYAGEFKALWTALNENYCIWDYEAEHGIDWDEVYATYLPQFEALDDSARTEPVSDAELSKLYAEFIYPLHDGHLLLQIFNKATGRYITLNPGRARNEREREEQFAAEGSHVTTLDAYRSDAVEPQYRVVDFDEVNAGKIIREHLQRNARIAWQNASAYLSAVDAAGGPDATNDSVYKYITEVRDAAYLIDSVTCLSYYDASMQSRMVNIYNYMCAQYGILCRQIGIVLNPVDTNVLNETLQAIQYALFAGNVAYLRLSAFGLTIHLDPAYRATDTTTMYYSYQMAVNRVWHRWFDTIQTLHANGMLGGVIIDVRNNGGGYVNDYRYVLGALLPSGGFESHTLRVKNGLGRYDFGPLVPFVMPTFEGDHAVIADRPIVALANSRSGSMAENTAWGVSQQPNGCFIGTRTYGALSALNTSPSDYSSHYSGAFGVRNVTPIYGYVPKYVGLYGDKLKPIEGIGIVPNKTVELDVYSVENGGLDNQLEAALNYIQSH